MDLELNIPNLDSFYRESLIQESTGNPDEHRRIISNDEPSFRGLSLDEIMKSKYSNSKGLDLLKDITEEIQLSGATTIKKWDYFDGDDMNMDRYNENLPYLEKRIKTGGDRQGKFVNLYVNITENAHINYKQLLHKAYTAIQICDLLESLGYSVNIYSRTSVKYLGVYKGQTLHTVTGNVLIKAAEEPLIKPLLLTTISPWFFRYWWFAFWTAKFKTGHGLGCSYQEDLKSDRRNIYIHTGECLEPGSVKSKLDEIKTLFDIEDE